MATLRIRNRRAAITGALYVLLGVLNLLFVDAGWLRWLVGASFVLLGVLHAARAFKPPAAAVRRTRLPGERHRVAVYFGLAQNPVAEDAPSVERPD